MINNIYSIKHISSAENNHEYIAHIDQNNNIFNGHFPDKPVVPGVCTIEAIKDCISHILNEKVNFACIKECKFTSAILPEEHQYVNISIKLSLKNDIKNATITVHNNNTIMVKMKASIA